jgi:hypothetical protein
MEKSRQNMRTNGKCKRLNIAEERISEPGNKKIETSKTEGKKSKLNLKKIRKYVQQMGDNYKSCSTCTMEMSKEKREGST